MFDRGVHQVANAVSKAEVYFTRCGQTGDYKFDLHRRAKTKNHAAQHDTKNAFRAEPRV